MNKYIFIIFAMLITTQSFATDLTGSSASCDSGVLGVESGNIALRAEYEPESIELRWYDENDNLITVNSASTSCTYGGSITLPATPTKTGYKFTGWKVINILTTLDATINAPWNSDYAKWKCISNSDCYTMLKNFGVENNNDLNNGEFSIIFSYGTVNGISLCSSTTASYATVGNPSVVSTGGGCWCRAKSYIPNNTDVKYDVSNLSVWVNMSNYDNYDNCLYNCARDCASGVQGYSTFRHTIFGQY